MKYVRVVAVTVGVWSLLGVIRVSQASELWPGTGPACQATAPARSGGRVSPADYRDAGSGAVFRLRVPSEEAVRFDVVVGPLVVEKLAWTNGDMQLVLRFGQDSLAVTRRAGELQIARHGQVVVVDMDALTDDVLGAVRVMVSDSTAVQRFRAFRASMPRRVLRSRAGSGVLAIDFLLGALAGDRPVEQPSMSAMALVEAGGDGVGDAGGDGPTCWEAYVTETTAAWDDYTSCVQQFAWYNPLREVCAFVWTLRAESAWFQFLSCSSIPIKKATADEPLPNPCD